MPNQNQYLVEQDSEDQFYHLMSFLENATLKDSIQPKKYETTISKIFSNFLIKYCDYNLSYTDINTLLNIVANYNNAMKKRINEQKLTYVFGCVNNMPADSPFNVLYYNIREFILNKFPDKKNIFDKYSTSNIFQILLLDLIYKNTIKEENWKDKWSLKIYDSNIIFETIKEAQDDGTYKTKTLKRNSFSIFLENNSISAHPFSFHVMNITNKGLLSNSLDDTNTNSYKYNEVENLVPNSIFKNFSINNNQYFSIGIKIKNAFIPLGELGKLEKEIISNIDIDASKIYLKINNNEIYRFNDISNEIIKNQILALLLFDNSTNSDINNLYDIFFKDIDENSLNYINLLISLSYEYNYKTKLIPIFSVTNTTINKNKLSACDKELTWNANNELLSFFDINIRKDLLDDNTFDTILTSMNKAINSYNTNENNVTLKSVDSISFVIIYKELNTYYRNTVNSKIQEEAITLTTSNIDNLIISGYEDSNLSSSIQSTFRNIKDENNIFFGGANLANKESYRYLYANPYKYLKGEESELISYYYGDSSVIADGYGAKNSYTENELKDFIDIFAETRDYFYTVLANEAFTSEDEYKLYRNLFISIWSVERSLTNKIKTIHDLDSLSKEEILNFLDSYGLKVLSDKLKTSSFINNEKYTRRLAKYYNELVKNKGSKGVADMLIKIFDFDDTEIDIQKYVLLENTSGKNKIFGLYVDSEKNIIPNNKVSISNIINNKNVFVKFLNQDIIQKEFIANIKVEYDNDTNFLNILENDAGCSFDYDDNDKNVLYEIDSIDNGELVKIDETNKKIIFKTFYTYSEVKIVNKILNLDSVKKYVSNLEYIPVSEEIKENGNGNLEFVETPYTSNNTTLDILNSIDQSIVYEELIASDKYWDINKTPAKDILNIGVDVSETKYLSLTLKENFYKSYAMARYALSIIDFIYERYIIGKDNNKNLLDKIIIEDTSINPGNPTRITLKEMYKAIRTLYRTLLVLYDYETLRSLNSSNEKAFYYGINEKFIMSNDSNDNIIKLLKDITLINDDDFFTKKYYDSNSEKTFNYIELYNDSSEVSDKIAGLSYLGEDTYYYLPKNRNIDNLKDKSKVLLYSTFAEKSAINIDSNRNSVGLNSGSKVIELLECLNPIILAKNQENNENIYFLNWYHAYTRNIKINNNITEDLDADMFYTDIFNKIIQIPLQYIEGILYPNEKNKLNLDRYFYNFISKLFNNLFLTNKNPLIEPNAYKEKSVTNKYFYSEKFNEENLNEFIYNDIECNIFTNITTDNGDYYLIKDNLESVRLNDFIEIIVEKLLLLLNELQELYSSLEFLSFKFSIGGNEGNELDFLKTAIEIFISYTVNIRTSQYVKEYNTQSESILLHEDLDVLGDYIKTDGLYLDDSLKIERVQVN